MAMQWDGQQLNSATATGSGGVVTEGGSVPSYAKAEHSQGPQLSALLPNGIASRLLPAAAAMTAQLHGAYDDPHTPLHPKKPLHTLLKRLTVREKKPPKSRIPLTRRNLEEFHNPNFKPDYDPDHVRDAFLTVRSQREISVHEWLQLLP